MSLAFQSTAIALTLLLLLGLGVALAWTYRKSTRYRRPKDRAVSLGLRIAALLLLFIPLLEPVLVKPDVVPDENFVAVLVDASRSMNVPDASDGRTRHDEARRLLVEAGIADDLEEHFKVRYYTFGRQARRSDGIVTETSDADQTNLSSALERVLSDFRGLPLSGVVLLTDGADNSDGVPLNLAETLHERDVPLHVVGLGAESAEDERELLQATVSRGVEATTGAEIDVKVRSWRDEGEPVSIGLYRGDELVHSVQRPLKGDGKVDYVTLFYEPPESSALEYTVRVETARGERNTENNEADILIDPRRDTLRVLFLEGHPRRDFKFIKRALEDDPAVHVASILRTGTGKYYRQGIRSPNELAGGFPTTEEELFGFRAVLLGDLEATHFSLEQLAMLERFVRVRGGGFAMLGGRATFAEGAYWNNPVTDLLPVEIDPGRRSVVPPSFREPIGLDLPEEDEGFRFEPTAEGLESPILKLHPDPQSNQSLWGSLPGLTSINYLGPIKPGATVLAQKPEDSHGASEPLLVVQRYGRGRSAAIATASTWRWQMQVDAEDNRHERFWRQFVRWIAASAPDRLEVTLEGDRYAPNDEITARVQVYRPDFTPATDATITATLTDSAGVVRPVAFRADLGIPGSYTATLLPTAEGVHVLNVAAETPDERITPASRSFLVRASRAEYHDAVLKRNLLEGLAAAADGAYYEPDEANEIPSNLRERRTSSSIYRASTL
ncbi:MAG TPA: hypothetical protein VF190_06780, partial [Rhodothermales bacterium]